MICQRISDLSCDKAAFEKAAPQYNQALQRSGFKHTIMYKPLQSFLHRSNNNNKKKRKKAKYYLVQSTLQRKCCNKYQKRIFLFMV